MSLCKGHVVQIIVLCRDIIKKNTINDFRGYDAVQVLENPKLFYLQGAKQIGMEQKVHNTMLQYLGKFVVGNRHKPLKHKGKHWKGLKRFEFLTRIVEISMVQKSVLTSCIKLL